MLKKLFNVLTITVKFMFTEQRNKIQFQVDETTQKLLTSHLLYRLTNKDKVSHKMKLQNDKIKSEV